MTSQHLIHYTAGCLECGASCSARNAQAWAHNHARQKGHRVEFTLGYSVTPSSTGDARQPKLSLKGGERSS